MSKRSTRETEVATNHRPSSVFHHTFIDTHCHLDLSQFNNDRNEVIKRAENARVEAIITIGSDLESNYRALEIAEQFSFIFASVGIHPHDAKDFTDEIFDQLKDWSEKKKVVAIGETGLDYHYDNSPRTIQKEVFVRHLELAKATGLPAIIHSREAKQDTLRIIEDSGINRGVLHCFSGDAQMAEKAVQMGLFISFAGPVTFKNANKLRDIVEIVPDDYLLIETDAPYLSPVPYRGKRNEPAYIVHTARTIAEIRGVTLEDVARITALNAKRLFRIGHLPSEGEIVYQIRNSLYLNITNRCTNQCSFCVRSLKDFVKGHQLRLSREPSYDELRDAIGNPLKYEEVVFCGYGEPLLRLDIVKEIASWVKNKGGKVRINTNGHGNLIHKRNILPELGGIVDSMSISLDAHDRESYIKLCRPSYANAYQGTLDFIKEAKKYIPHIILTVVDIKGIDIDKCRKIAEKFNVGFKVRKLDEVG